MVLALNRWITRDDMKLGCADGAKGSNAAADRGIRYHRRVFRALQPSPIPGMDPVIEPWLREVGTGRHCQPDALLVDLAEGVGIVVEVKLNWKDGRDEKLHNLYLPAVKSAYNLTHVWPLLITSNLRGYSHPPLLGLDAIVDAMSWSSGQPTPLLLYP